MAEGPQAPDSTPEAPAKRRRERRLARHLRHARTVWQQPRAAGPLVRQALLGVWRSRGGGFYGLGYLVTFVVLEAGLIATEFAASSGVLDFVSSQLVEYLLRLGLMSFVNVLLAFLWPLLLLKHLGPWGLAVLAGGYLVYLRWIRSLVESAFPELARKTGEE